MERLLMFSAPYFQLQSFGTLVYCLSWGAIILLAWKFLKRRHLNSLSPAIPQPKSPFYSLYGMFGVFPSRSTRQKLGLPATAFIENLISGIAAMYPGEKIIRFPAGLHDWILLTKPESVKEFLLSKALVTRTHEKIFLSLFGNTLFTSTGPKWTKRKKLIMPLFHYDILKDLVPTFDKHSKVLVNILKRKHHETWIDVANPVNLCIMDVACETFLGINIDGQNKDSKFLNAAIRMARTVMERIINPLLQFEIIFMNSAIGRKFRGDLRYITAFAEKVIQEHKEAKIPQEKENNELSGDRNIKRNNLLQTVLDSFENNEDISDVCLTSELIGLVLAAADTSGVGVGWALYFIGLYPKIQSKIHEELDTVFGDNQDSSVTADDLKELHYLECVLKESQRLCPSVPYNAKYVLEDFNLCGYVIKKGNIILVDTYDLHRNPEVFPNPEVFDPDRFLPQNCVGRHPFAYIPFSAGSRTCPGRRFAMMQAKTLVANVLRNFSLETLDHRDKVCRSSEIVLRSPQPLKLKFYPRKAYANL